MEWLNWKVPNTVLALMLLIGFAYFILGMLYVLVSKTVKTVHRKLYLTSPKKVELYFCLVVLFWPLAYLINRHYIRTASFPVVKEIEYQLSKH